MRPASVVEAPRDGALAIATGFRGSWTPLGGSFMSRTNLASWSLATTMLVIAGCSCGDGGVAPGTDTGPLPIDGGPRDGAVRDTALPDIGNVDVGPLGRCGNGMVEGFE